MANQFAIGAPINIYECTDGNIYGGVILDSHWKILAAEIGREELGHLTNAERVKRRSEVDGALADWCRVRSAAEVEEILSGIGLAVTRVNTYAESSQTELVKERDMLQQTTLTDGTEVQLTGPAAKFSRTPTKIHNPAPSLGQNNAEILGGLGLSEDDIAKLRDEGVV